MRLHSHKMKVPWMLIPWTLPIRQKKENQMFQQTTEPQSRSKNQELNSNLMLLPTQILPSLLSLVTQAKSIWPDLALVLNSFNWMLKVYQALWMMMMLCHLRSNHQPLMTKLQFKLKINSKVPVKKHQQKRLQLKLLRIHQLLILLLRPQIQVLKLLPLRPLQLMLLPKLLLMLQLHQLLSLPELAKSKLWMKLLKMLIQIQLKEQDLNSPRCKLIWKLV